MISNVARKAGAGLRRGIGNLAHGVRRVADFTKPIAMGVGRFVADNHQPLSMLAHGIGEATGNPVMKGIGNAALIGSGLASAAGIGKDYIGMGGS